MLKDILKMIVKNNYSQNKEKLMLIQLIVSRIN